MCTDNFSGTTESQQAPCLRRVQRKVGEDPPTHPHLGADEPDNFVDKETRRVWWKKASP